VKNEYMRPASELSLPVPAGTKSGDAVIVGALPGVAATDRNEGTAVNAAGNIPGTASVLLDDRAYIIPVTGAITGPGQPVYIPAAGGALNVSSTSAVLWGYTIQAADGTYATKASGTGPALVKPAKV
jgi:hypothetical protein